MLDGWMQFCAEISIKDSLKNIYAEVAHLIMGSLYLIFVYFL